MTPNKHTRPYAKSLSARFFLSLCLNAALLLGVLFSTPQSSWGYVLPGPHLLLLMTEGLGTASSLVVHQRLYLYGEIEGEMQPYEISETLTYRFSNAFRSERISPRLNRIHVDSLDDVVTIIDDMVSIQKDNLLDRYKDLLLFHSRVLLEERLSKTGIDPMISSLGRFNGVSVYVVGARYPDTTSPQVWLEKESFRPLRLLIPKTDEQGGKSILEFRYLQWQKNNKLWYPMLIQCFSNDRLIREMIVDEMIVNPLIADDRFDIDRLRGEYGMSREVETEATFLDVPSDIQKALDDFKKRYEQ